MRLTQIIEALLFASDAPLSAADLSRVDERLDEDTVEAVIQELRSEYELSERSFQIYEVGGGFQLLTRPEFVTVLERYESVPQPSRLSAPALEVLAIIAYRQPLGRAEIEDIRGVGSSGVLRTLQDRSLIEPVARGEGLGRPLLYGTTQKFLEHFGFRSLEDLPRPDELPVVLRDRTPVATLPLEEEDASPDAPSPQEPAAGGSPAAEAAAEAPTPGEAELNSPAEDVSHIDAPSAQDVPDIDAPPVEDVPDVDESPVEDVPDVDAPPVEDVPDIDAPPVEDVPDIDAPPVDDVPDIDAPPAQDPDVGEPARSEAGGAGFDEISSQR